MRELCTIGKLKVLPKGTSITSSEEVSGVYYLEEGLCALIRYTKNGEEIIYHYFQKGDLLGGVYYNLANEKQTYIHNPNKLSYFTTKTDVVLYKIEYKDLNKLISKKPEISHLISKSMAVHFQAIMGHFHASKDEYTTIRLCKFLINFSQSVNGEYLLDRHFTYVEIAKYLGVHSVTISRMMLDFKKRGIIEKQGHMTKITDREKLIEMINAPEEV